MGKLTRKTHSKLKHVRKFTEVEVPSLLDEDGNPTIVTLRELTIADIMQHHKLMSKAAEAKGKVENMTPELILASSEMLVTAATKCIVDAETRQPFLSENEARDYIFGHKALLDAVTDQLNGLGGDDDEGETSPTFPAQQQANGASDSDSASPSVSPTPTISPPHSHPAN